MDAKRKVVACFLAFLMLVTFVYGANYIWSNTVTVTVREYQLTLQASPGNPIRYQNVTFSGRLTLGTSGVAGETVELCFANGTFTGLSAVSNSTGYYAIQWNATEVGSFDFKTRVMP